MMKTGLQVKAAIKCLCKILAAAMVVVGVWD